ncbi:hypothetical protein [Paraflavitalea speifideaquila]|uniref:hypothetical protein n=1 Tax=Paraflavitalea speifideaquila TaxID=3076558 RepID=UPI0028E3D84B|nr:hypothetical protein [Paraflavitalea speifideiaquila]
MVITQIDARFNRACIHAYQETTGRQVGRIKYNGPCKPVNVPVTPRPKFLTLNLIADALSAGSYSWAVIVTTAIRQAITNGIF